MFHRLHHLVVTALLSITAATAHADEVHDVDGALVYRR